MSIRYRLAVVLALIVLPLILGVGVIMAVMVPGRLQAAQTRSLDIAARSVGSAMSFECGALGYRAQVIALSVANGQDPKAVLAAQGTGRSDADSYDIVRAPGRKPVTRGTVTGSETDLPAQRCSLLPVTVDRSASGTPLLVEQASVATTQGPIVVSSVERITPGWVRAVTAAAQVGAVDVRLFCPTGSVQAGTVVDDVTWREAAAVAGQPCVVRAGEKSVAGGDVRWLSALLLAGSLILGAVLIVWLANRLTAPIVELSHAARRATAGDRAVRIAPAGRDEIGELGRDFTTMVTELDRLITDAERGNDALRATSRRLGDILQRTHDLDGMLTALCALAETTAGGTCASVWMTDDTSQRLRTVHPIGTRRPPTRRVPMGADRDGSAVSAVAEAAAARATRSVPDAAEDAASILGGRVLALPLMSGERVLGVLAVERPASQPPFGDDEVERLELAIGSAGVAVDNAMLHRAVQRQSVVDPLTGVGNMRALTGALGREIERAQRFGRPVSVLVIDIDHFREVNERFGPPVGDGLLTELAAFIGAHVRTVDSVSRYGGEEFAVVCPELGAEHGRSAAQRVVEAVRDHEFTVLGRSVRVTVSIGVAAHPADGATAMDLLAAADRAMARAKADGRDRVAAAS